VNFGKKVGEREGRCHERMPLITLLPPPPPSFCRPFRDADGSSSLSNLEIMT
jgi:hypothetical protein